MTYLTDPSLDEATLSDRSQEIQPLNTIESPEQRSDSGLGDGDYPEYFQMRDFSRWCMQFFLSPAEAEGGEEIVMSLTVHASWEFGETAQDAEYIDMTNALTGVDSIDILSAIDTLDVIIDNLELMKGAAYVLVNINIQNTVVGTSSYVLDKNARGI